MTASTFFGFGAGCQLILIRSFASISVFYRTSVLKTTACIYFYICYNAHMLVETESEEPGLWSNIQDKLRIHHPDVYSKSEENVHLRINAEGVIAIDAYQGKKPTRISARDIRQYEQLRSVPYNPIEMLNSSYGTITEIGPGISELVSEIIKHTDFAVILIDPIPVHAVSVLLADAYETAPVATRETIETLQDRLSAYYSPRVKFFNMTLQKAWRHHENTLVSSSDVVIDAFGALYYTHKPAEVLEMERAMLKIPDDQYLWTPGRFTREEFVR